MTRTHERTHALVRLETAALIAVGGFAGANLRYVLGGTLPGLGGTLVANVLGSFALGFLAYEAVYAGVLSDRGRLVLATGFLSSFTTYSTFVVQTALAPEWAVLNVGANYALGFAAVLAGRAIAGRVEAAR